MKNYHLLIVLMLSAASDVVFALQHGGSYRIRVYCPDGLKTSKIMKNKKRSLKLDAIFSSEKYEKFILAPRAYDLVERICIRMKVLTNSVPSLMGTNAGEYESFARSYPVRRSKPKVVPVIVDPPLEDEGENLPVVEPEKTGKSSWFSWVPKMLTYLSSANQATEIKKEVLKPEFACPKYLEGFEDDCEYYIRYAKIKKALIAKNVAVENLAYYRAIRLINQRDLSSPRNPENVLEPWFIYKPFKTWFYWEEGNRFLLLLKAHIKEQQKLIVEQAPDLKLFTLTLDQLKSHHQRYMDKELTAPDWTKESDFLKWVGSIYIKTKPDPGFFRPVDQTSSGFWLSYLNETEKAYVKAYDMVTESTLTPDTWIPLVTAPGKWVTYYQGEQPDDLETAMQKLVEDVNTNMTRILGGTPAIVKLRIKGVIKNVEMGPIAYSAYLQKRYVSLHPFHEGNGRMSRFLQDLVTSYLDLPYVPGGLLQNDVGMTTLKYAELTLSKVDEILTGLETCVELYSSPPVTDWRCKDVYSIRGKQFTPKGIAKAISTKGEKSVEDIFHKVLEKPYSLNLDLLDKSSPNALLLTEESVSQFKRIMKSKGWIPLFKNIANSERIDDIIKGRIAEKNRKHILSLRPKSGFSSKYDYCYCVPEYLNPYVLPVCLAVDSDSWRGVRNAPKECLHIKLVRTAYKPGEGLDDNIDIDDNLICAMFDQDLNDLDVPESVLSATVGSNGCLIEGRHQFILKRSPDDSHCQAAFVKLYAVEAGGMLQNLDVESVHIIKDFPDGLSCKDARELYFYTFRGDGYINATSKWHLSSDFKVAYTNYKKADNSQIPKILFRAEVGDSDLENKNVSARHTWDHYVSTSSSFRISLNFLKNAESTKKVGLFILFAGTESPLSLNEVSRYPEGEYLFKLNERFKVLYKCKEVPDYNVDKNALESDMYRELIAIQELGDPVLDENFSRNIGAMLQSVMYSRQPNLVPKICVIGEL